MRNPPDHGEPVPSQQSAHDLIAKTFTSNTDQMTADTVSMPSISIYDNTGKVLAFLAYSQAYSLTIEALAVDPQGFAARASDTPA